MNPKIKQLINNIENVILGIRHIDCRILFAYAVKNVVSENEALLFAAFSPVRRGDEILREHTLFHHDYVIFANGVMTIARNNEERGVRTACSVVGENVVADVNFIPVTSVVESFLFARFFVNHGVTVFVV